jgi:transcriptional regulator with XRE-family HTH domain
MPTATKGIGHRVRTLRYARNPRWTQEELARAAGVSNMSVSNIERNEHASPRIATLRKIADALGVPLSDLIS